MNILFLGDIVGSVGRECVREQLPRLKEQYEIDLVVANAENSAHGKGITRKIYHQLLAMGIDVCPWEIIPSLKMIFISLLRRQTAWFAQPIWSRWNMGSIPLL